MTNPIAYVDAATMMRGVGAGVPIKATKPDVVHLPGGCVAPDQDRKRSRAVRIAITAGGASLAIFTAFMGKLGMKLDDVQLISVATTTNLATALVASRSVCALAGIGRTPIRGKQPTSR